MKSSLINSLLLFVLILSFVKSDSESNAYTKYKLNDHFFFDPISTSACNHINYWTPFNQNTTCYRWVSLIANDTTSNEKITIMLDHNYAQETYDKLNEQLNTLRVLWKRAPTSYIYVPTEQMIYNLMGFKAKPTPGTATAPAYRVGELLLNNRYVNDGKVYDSGYWTNTSYNDTYAYSFTTTGNNEVILKNSTRGFRPILTISKSLLKVIPGAITINTLLTSGKVYKYKWENKTYGGVYYRSLQAFTVFNDTLIFSSANNSNPNYCVLYAYKGTSFEKLVASKYDACGHGNGITYNPKINKIQVCGPASYTAVNQYSTSLAFEKSYATKDKYPSFIGIGYNKDKDYYLGYTGRNIYFSLTTDLWPVKYSFNYPCFETTQDIEYNDGYIFMPVYDCGGPNDYQLYSMWGKGNNLVYVFNTTMETSGVQTKNFGRLVARLFIQGIGELESISFSNNKAYFGFNTMSSKDNYSRTFYEIPYSELKKVVETKTNENDEDGKPKINTIKFLEE